MLDLLHAYAGMRRWPARKILTHPEAPDDGGPSLIDCILPLACFIVALPPRLWRLGSRPFWFDEVGTWQRASLPVPALIWDSFAHHHMPLYFLLVAPFTHVDNPQFWMRFPSAVFGAFCVMLTYLAAARIAGRGAGIAAALITGLAPIEIAYAQEARSYTLQMCFILLALHGLLGLVLAAERSALPWRDARAPRADWLQFIAGTTLAFCTLGDSLPWLLAADGSAAMLVWRAPNKPRMFWNFLAANGIILAVCMPLYGCMLYAERYHPFAGIGYGPAPTLLLVWDEIGSVYLLRIGDFMTFLGMAVPTPAAVVWGIGVGLSAGCAAGLWRLRARPPVLYTLLLALLVLPLFFAVISIWTPMLIPRYLLWSAAPFAMLAGIGIAAGAARLGREAGGFAGVAGALLLLINLAPFYNAEIKPRWDIVAQILAARARPGDFVLLSQPVSVLTLQYYLPDRLKSSLMTVWSGDRLHAIQAQTQGHRVWGIFGGGAHTALAGSETDFYTSLAPLGVPAFTERAGSRITVWRFDPRPAQATRQRRKTSL